MLSTRQKVLQKFLVRDAADRRSSPTAQSRSGCSARTSCCFSMRKGEPAALEDRCCHRTAKLSKGWIKDGNIVCGYHGWEYDRDGKLVNVPQFPFEQPIPDARAKNFKTAQRYGYVWVCLGEPLQPLPDVPYDTGARPFAPSTSSTTAGTAARCA